MAIMITRENYKNRLPPAFCRMVECFWRPDKRWLARCAEASQQVPEESGDTVDPETILWNSILEEVRNDGRPPVDLHPITLDEGICQRQPKRMFCR
jgi:hypothetical protein